MSNRKSIYKKVVEKVNKMNHTELSDSIMSANPQFNGTHSIMLSQIASEVEEFCETSETTTYQAVLEMKAQLLEAKAKVLRFRAKLAVD